MTQIVGGLPIVENFVTVLDWGICSSEGVGEEEEVERSLRIDGYLTGGFPSRPAYDVRVVEN